MVSTGRARSGFRREPVLIEDLPNALRGVSPDALVDAECLTQVQGCFAAVAVVEVGPAESFQGVCLLEGHADIPRDGERPDVVLTGLAGGRGPAGELAEAVQRLGLAEPVTEIAEHRQGRLDVAGGGRVVPGH